MKSKFIVYNYTPNTISDEKLMFYVNEVILQGKVSNNDTEYCYVTTFGKVNKNVVSTRKTKTGYRFDVYNEDELRKIREEKINNVED